ncbi:hypothetical protein SAMN05216386_1788 [Nitrosospira briensis]|uniref:Uncharacterized protein n=1 Tax=Nitrosospira briensis TaxID=35799 RepID=A0A1I5BRM8_9PROT|nr:hypothetical protein SAMN05216386_1788 [Nitrosospira briensis]
MVTQTALNYYNPFDGQVSILDLLFNAGQKRQDIFGDVGETNLTKGSVIDE